MKIRLKSERTVELHENHWKRLSMIEIVVDDSNVQLIEDENLIKIIINDYSYEKDFPQTYQNGSVDVKKLPNEFKMPKETNKNFTKLKQVLHFDAQKEPSLRNLFLSFVENRRRFRQKPKLQDCVRNLQNLPQSLAV